MGNIQNHICLLKVFGPESKPASKSIPQLTYEIFKRKRIMTNNITLYRMWKITPEKMTYGEHIWMKMLGERSIPDKKRCLRIST